MDYNEFEAKVASIAEKSEISCGQYIRTGYLKSDYDRGRKWGYVRRHEITRYHKDDQYRDIETVMQVSWSTGGMSGGSCWGGEPTHYTSSDTPKELTLLDEVLCEFCPNISFLMYKNLYNNLVEYDTRTESEYYGNSTDYATLTIKIKKLHQYLEEKGWLK